MGRRGGRGCGGSALGGSSAAARASGGGGCSYGGGRSTSQSGGPQASAPEAARAAANNRANQKNPNNSAFYKARGEPCRPSTWQSTVDDRRARGQREHVLNMAAAETAEQRAAHARDVVRAERVVKDVLGGQAQVWKGGGRNKHNNLAGGDLDLLIEHPKTLDAQDRNDLGAAFRDEFGSSCVSDRNPRIHQIRGEGGPIDVVPQKAAFFPDGRTNKLPRNPFRFNPQARLAVRDVKQTALVEGQNVKGHAAECAVLTAQQRHPRADFHTLCNYACAELFG
eukprot:TRINITY_DN81483_c0_g1_i1.p1 TRINITY_DN81483_c0_g1~~TRINITY_DN81483_c0_g1_i1.p1  ORF type:complete len:281 (-),score=41.88 TRINITY_DN81483_c0_g1_i1:144-986(-)